MSYNRYKVVEIYQPEIADRLDYEDNDGYDLVSCTQSKPYEPSFYGELSTRNLPSVPAKYLLIFRKRR